MTSPLGESLKVLGRMTLYTIKSRGVPPPPDLVKSYIDPFGLIWKED